MKAIKIDVLKKHIKNGVPEQASFCMVALAMKDKGCSKVKVEETHTEFRRGKKFYCFYFPGKVRKLIQRFDDLSDDPIKRHKIKPFSFNLELREVD